MRRLFFGLALILVVAGGRVSAGEALPATGSDSSQQAQRPASHAHPAKHDKQIAKTQPAPLSLPLSSNEAYAAQHAPGLPVSPPAKSASPTTNSWTGFYVGAGVGASHE